MRDFTVFLLLAAAATGLIGGATFTIADAFRQYDCNAYSEVTGRETRYVDFNTCYVRYGDEWYSLDEHKAIVIARENLKSQ